MARLIKFSIILTLLSSGFAYALEGEDKVTPIGAFVLRQERYTKGAISVSRPLPLDERIRDFIIVNSISSLEDYLSWLRDNIRYRKDEDGDNWAAPEETLRKGYADCEDFAFLNQAVLRVIGYEPQVLAIGGLGAQHAICIFKKKDRFVWLDNARLKETSATTLEEFARQLFIQCGNSYLLTVDWDTRDLDLLMKRSDLVREE